MERTCQRINFHQRNQEHRKLEVNKKIKANKKSKDITTTIKPHDWKKYIKDLLVENRQNFAKEQRQIQRRGHWFNKKSSNRRNKKVLEICLENDLKMEWNGFETPTQIIDSQRERYRPPSGRLSLSWGGSIGSRSKCGRQGSQVGRLQFTYLLRKLIK